MHRVAGAGVRRIVHLVKAVRQLQSPADNGVELRELDGGIDSELIRRKATELHARFLVFSVDGGITERDP